MILSSRFLTFDKAFIPNFLADLCKPAFTFDKVWTFRQTVCRIVETYPKVGATFDKYAAKQGKEPLSKPMKGGKQTW